MGRRFATAFVLWFACVTQAAAIGLLRDPDIERGLREIAKPILNAAGLSSSRVRILVVNDSSLNAFVIDRNHIFIHSGLLMRLKTVDELQAVIAHEAAHIANGHITRRIGNARRAKAATIFGILLAAAAGANGNGEVAGGIAAGVAGSAQRLFLAHTRAQESSADQSALRYMRSAGADLGGMLGVFELFRGQEALSASRQDPYSRSHPMTRDRLRAVRGHVTAVGPRRQNNANLEFWFARAQGKLSAFKRAPSWTLRRARGDDSVSLMRQAVAQHRQGRGERAIALINRVVASRPNDPYFRELQGQILLENRQFDAATRAYDQAARMAPRDALILGGYGRALLATKTSTNIRKALDILIKARGIDARDARILRDLGSAYAQTGNRGMASLVIAERFMLQGDVASAATQAERAAGLLRRGSAAWQKAQDILFVANGK